MTSPRRSVVGVAETVVIDDNAYDNVVLVVVGCHAYAGRRNMYLLKIGFSRITPANLNGFE